MGKSRQVVCVEGKTMNQQDLKNLIDRLEYYNEWRRGADTEMPQPKQIGRDIDAAVEVLRDVERGKG
jgi:hypothetical protein